MDKEIHDIMLIAASFCMFNRTWIGWRRGRRNRATFIQRITCRELDILSRIMRP
jgi:hypothetical protein